MEERRKPDANRQAHIDKFNAAKARKEAALAELAELELATKRKELLPADAVQRHWEGMIASMRSRLLALPSRLAGVVMGVATTQDAEREAMQLVREALEEIARPGVPHE